MSQLEDLMSKGVNLLIAFVAVQGGPCDPFFAELKEDRNACVVVVDAFSETADYWIKSNDYDIGQIQGEQCANYLLSAKGEVSGKIAVISHKSYQNMISRAQGFKDYMAKYPDVEFIDERFPTDIDASLMMQLTEDILQVYAQGAIDVLYCTNQTETEGANAAIISAKRQDVTLFGVDDSQTLREALQDPNSTLQSVVAQSPADMGRQAVDYGVAWLKGEAGELSNVYEAPLRLITRDTVLDWIKEQDELDAKLAPYYQY
jgi:ABC-type sugar transport system substrate-binding protein